MRVDERLANEKSEDTVRLFKMNDLISRRLAIDAADYTDYRGLTIEDVKKVTDEVVKELKKLPPVDAVQVIRCKDCKYWHREIYNGVEYFNFSSCDLNHRGDGNSFYCADAERKES